MARKRPKITKSLQKLIDLFKEIEDEDIREIIAEVVRIERGHRSLSGKRFPMKKVRDVVDSTARLQEEREKNHAI
ncbi:MAG: hypothetical protein B6243_01750 [Anaerolineaceae bacterium 4572_5.2]|nr:MAG: hypothetical protein B6243_01750 [Anaerolineaceae bacterium 4572_5.2]